MDLIEKQISERSSNEEYLANVFEFRPDGDDSPCGEAHAVELSDGQNGGRLVKRHSVHVQRRPEKQNEATDPPIHDIPSLQTIQSDR
jgi:hypothetical protein